MRRRLSEHEGPGAPAMRRHSDHGGAPVSRRLSDHGSPSGLTLLGRLRVQPSEKCGSAKKPEAAAAPCTPRAPPASSPQRAPPASSPQRRSLAQMSPGDAFTRTASCASSPKKRGGEWPAWQRVEVWSSTASGWTPATLVALDRCAGGEDIITVEFSVPGVGRCGKRLYATSDRVRMLPVDEDEDRLGLTHTKTNAATCGVDEEQEDRRARGAPDPLEAPGSSPARRRKSAARLERALSRAAADLAPGSSSTIALSGLDSVVLGEKLGAGSFGVVYAGTIEATSQQVAVKVEPADVRVPQLEGEAEVLRALQGEPLVAGLHWHGSRGSYNIMVMDLLGPSVEDVFEGNDRKFSAVRVAKLAAQMFACIRYMHGKGFLHRDIKPSNFTLGLGRQASQVRVIDFGLAKPYRNGRGIHYPPATGVSFVGTLRYASIRAHARQEQSRRDDLQSLGYVFAYLLRGRLPWQGIDAPSKEERRAEILKAKRSTPPPLLFAGRPPQFPSYMCEVSELGHFQDPPYDQLEALLREVVGSPTN